MVEAFDSLSEFIPPPLDEKYIFSFQVPEVAQLENTPTQYVITIQNCSQKWSIKKRYSELRTFDANLRKIEDKQYLDFPKKKALGRFKDAFIEKRRNQIENYLRGVACVESWVKSEVFAEFVDQPPLPPPEKKKSKKKKSKKIASLRKSQSCDSFASSPYTDSTPPSLSSTPGTPTSSHAPPPPPPPAAMPSSPARKPSPPPASGERGDLLAAIRKGKNLKKADTVDKSGPRI
eukprot:GCRY01003029.1.p1 GENE.GCRY01003029.1~~GCRY01003029.1.p1  ORF type:complete len:233 (-),score=33.75 GCRY01003029.1:410-1108(-)